MSATAPQRAPVRAFRPPFVAPCGQPLLHCQPLLYCRQAPKTWLKPGWRRRAGVCVCVKENRAESFQKKKSKLFFFGKSRLIKLIFNFSNEKKSTFCLLSVMILQSFSRLINCMIRFAVEKELRKNLQINPRKNPTTDFFVNKFATVKDDPYIMTETKKKEHDKANILSIVFHLLFSQLKKFFILSQ